MRSRPLTKRIDIFFFLFFYCRLARGAGIEAEFVISPPTLPHCQFHCRFGVFCFLLPRDPTLY